MSGYVLYAMPGSLYSAKARAFMRKHGSITSSARRARGTSSGR